MIAAHPAIATTATAASPATAVRLGHRRAAATTATSSAGPASTQWCDQEMGETSRLVTAHSANACAAWPARPARAASAIPAPPTAAAAGSHTGPTVSVPSTRASAPSRLWLATFWIRPTCAGSRKLRSQ